MGPPIVIQLLSGSDSSLCPLTVIENLLQVRSSLQLDHDFVFTQFQQPFEKISAASFSQRLAWVLRRANISAPPGSTRSVVVVVVVAPDAVRRVEFPVRLPQGDGSGGGRGGGGSLGISMANMGRLTKYSTTLTGLTHRSFQ